MENENLKTLLIDDLKNIKTTKVVRTFNEGIKALTEEKWDALFLDHDLACFDTGKEQTGYDILCWLEIHPEYLPKEIQIVSMNPVGKQKMLQLIDRLYPNRKWKTRHFPDDFKEEILEAEFEVPTDLEFNIEDSVLEQIFGRDK